MRKFLFAAALAVASFVGAEAIACGGGECSKDQCADKAKAAQAKGEEVPGCCAAKLAKAEAETKAEQAAFGDKLHTVSIEGLKCSKGCVATIKDVLAKVEGVQKVWVDFKNKEVKVAGEFDKAAVIGKLIEAGYTVKKFDDEEIAS
ncbi:MAG: heavy-metal-associated domain-containing protein [Planctomycetota bacterium]|jgi:copper chaperone CopZ